MPDKKRGLDVKGYAAIGGEPPDIDSPKSAERHWEWAEHEEAERLRLELQADQQRRAATIERERTQATAKREASYQYALTMQGGRSKSPTSASSSISGSTHSKYDAVPSAAVENHVNDAALHLGSSSTYHRHEKPQHSIAPFFTTLLRIVLGLVAFALCVMGGAWAVEAAKNRFDPVSIILTADPGNLVGLSERSLLEERMTLEATERTGSALCDRVIHGRLLGQRVLLVTTGIGHDRAAVCLSGLLDQWYLEAKEVLFLGTAGFSPLKGGVLNSDHCGSPTPAQEAEPTVMGDVCVSQFATNWDCQKCVFPDSVASACMAAPCSMHARNDLFGEFEQGFVAPPDLSREVLEASGNLKLPPQPPALKAYSQRYWAAMSQGTGQPYFQGEEGEEEGSSFRSTPKLWDYMSCGEASSDSFWVGAPYDELARSYIAAQINQANANGVNNAYVPGTGDDEASPDASLPKLPVEPVSKQNTIAVSAMEGVGWMSVLFYGEKNLGRKHIPAVNIRGAADHVHPPLYRQARSQSPLTAYVNATAAAHVARVDATNTAIVAGASLEAAAEAGTEAAESIVGGAATTTSNEDDDVVWKNDLTWATKEELADYATEGYKFSINTTSEVVLSLFKRRVEQQRAAASASSFFSRVWPSQRQESSSRSSSTSFTREAGSNAASAEAPPAAKMMASFFVPPSDAEAPRSLMERTERSGSSSGEDRETGAAVASSLSRPEVVEVEVATSNERGEAEWPSRMKKVPILVAVSEGPVAKASAERAKTLSANGLGSGLGKETKRETKRLGGRMSQVQNGHE